MLDYSIFDELGETISPKIIESTYGVNINDFDIVRVRNDVIKMIAFDFFPLYITQKEKEFGHKIDPEKEFKRCYTGFLGEAAVEEGFGITFIDWSVAHSKWYNYADMRSIGLNVGIKTCSNPNFPLIKIHSYRPQLINIRVSVNEVLVGGFADMYCVKNYVDINKVLDKNVIRKGKKTAFVGTDKLKYVYTLDDLKGML